MQGTVLVGRAALEVELAVALVALDVAPTSCVTETDFVERVIWEFEEVEDVAFDVPVSVAELDPTVR